MSSLQDGPSTVSVSKKAIIIFSYVIVLATIYL